MSGLGRYIVDAVVLEHRSPTQLARDHDISKRWIFKLLRRFKDGGYAAIEPRSRRPKSCSSTTRGLQAWKRSLTIASSTIIRI